MTLVILIFAVKKTVICYVFPLWFLLYYKRIYAKLKSKWLILGPAEIQGYPLAVPPEDKCMVVHDWW